MILYNGINISEIDYDQYRRLLSVVFQDYQLFAFSVKDNIILDQPWDAGAVADAVEKSGLELKIEALERGLDTSISKEFDENGIEFSGGEAQKRCV